MSTPIYPRISDLSSLERELLQCLWQAGSQTNRQLLTIFRRERPMAYITLNDALEQLCARGLLTRQQEASPLSQSTWSYTPTLSRQAFLIQSVEQLCGSFGASNIDRQYLAAAVRHGSLAVG